MNEPAARRADVRVGSSTDALTPLAGAHRSLAARSQQWLGLSAIALAALAGDQLTKNIVSSQLGLDAERHVAGPLSIHHVQNSGIAFGLFASATPIVTALTAVAVVWMLFFFARSGARHPVLPVALGLLIGGSASNLTDRITAGPRDRFHRRSLLAGVQPGRRLHRPRSPHPPRRAAASPTDSAAAAAGSRRSTPAFLRRRRATASTGSSPSCRRSARARLPSVC